MPSGRLRVLSDPAALAHAAAELVVEEARAADAARGTFRLVLSGGRTPRTLFYLLAGPAGVGFPWERTHVFFSDERHVPSTHPENTARLARGLLLDRVPVPPDHIHGMPVGSTPEDDARRHEAELKAHFGSAAPSFDLALLGLGEDGHTASLFPGTPTLSEKERWVVPVRGPKPPYARLTMTLPLLCAARRVVFLVTGKEKTDALRGLLEERSNVPAALVRPLQPPIILADREAASDIPSSGT